jgi:hypothetical protein
MSVILFLSIIIVMPVITFLFACMKEKQLSHNSSQIKELDILYAYKYILINTEQIRSEIQTKLASINYNHLQYEPFFSHFEINILKKEIDNSIEELEELILDESITVDGFHFKIDQLRKRTDIIQLPSNAIQRTAGGNYYKRGKVA